MHWKTFTLVAALAGVAAPACPAQVLPEAPVGLPTDPDPPSARRAWYGWQTLIAFGTSAAVSFVPSEGLGAALGGIGLVFGGPIVHWAHDHLDRGFGSLALNVGLSLAGGGIAIAAARPSPGDDLTGLVAALVGASVGLATAMVIDVTVLAYDDVSEAPARRPAAWIAPDLRLSPAGARVGLVGAF